MTELIQVIDHNGTANGDVPDLPQERLVQLYEAMLTTRLMNERGMKLQRQGRINFYIGSEGQEAAHVGFGAAFEDTDWYFPHYRDLGVAALRGCSISDMVHQCYGSRKDLVQGRQMPNHFSFPDGKYFSVSSPLSTQIPQAVGAAYAARLKGDGRIVGTSFGDGSTSEGDFHVAMNFAGVWKAPCVFLCQNNQWAISVPTELQTASETFAQKADAYGFPGVRVDGNDVLAVYRVTQEAVERARRGEGPTLIEAVTYRMGPHSSSDDPSRYVPEAELEEWRRRDPIERYKTFLVKAGHLSEAEEAKLRERIDQEIRAAVKEADQTPPPSLESLVEDVYAQVPWHLAEQIEDLKRFYEEE